MLGRFVLAFAFIALVSTGLDAQTGKDKADKTDPKVIVGKVVSVDENKSTVTIVVDGKNQTFTVNDDTEIVGPRGGVSKERLKDDRFTKGYEITVTPSKDPKIAAKIKLDYRPSATKDKDTPTKDAPMKDKDTPTKDKDTPTKDKKDKDTTTKDKDTTVKDKKDKDATIKDKDKTPTKDKDATTTVKDKDKTPPKDK
jgi:hypothetical protein